MADNNNTKILNVPNLRFPEFSREWENKTIDELFELRNGYTPSKANHDFWEGGTIPWFRMEDIRQNGGILSDAIQHITPKAIKGSGLFERYSIILATTATIGEHAMLIADSLANQRFTNFKVRKSLTNSYNPYYLYYYFFKIDRWCLRNVNAGGLLSVDIPSLKRERLFAPCLKEQNKIAQLMRHIDERIATQSKIIDKLKSLIKGLSQQLLSSENDWILYRLDDLAQIKSGYSGTQVGYQTPYKVSRIETISKHCVDIQRIGYVEYISESYKLNVGDILFSNINSVQYIGNTAYLDKDYGLYHGMNLLRIIPNTTIVRPRFLHLLLCTDWAINHFQTICNKAVSQASINQTALGKSRLPIPPMSIQQQICSMFELTERKLNNEEKYRGYLQQQKWYLLQQMFI